MIKETDCEMALQFALNQRNASQNECIELAMQLKKAQQRIAELEAQLAERALCEAPKA